MHRGDLAQRCHVLLGNQDQDQQEMKDEGCSAKVSYLTKDETSNDEVGGGPPLSVHWDQAHGLSQLHSHALHLAVAQHPQHSLQRGTAHEHGSLV